MARFGLHRGDCIAVLKKLPDSSVDSCVTDPPYELGFMGKGWDKTGIATNVELWREVLRVLKPGGHLLAFGGTRTYHRMVCAIEDAGFQIRDQIGWLYGSGFPKSLDVSKAIDKANGAKREVVGNGKNFGKTKLADGKIGFGDCAGEWNITSPFTLAAKQWNGWGTALKPAWEPIVVARKPLVGTVAENVQLHGTGAINVDACRVAMQEDDAAAFLEMRDSWASHDGKASPGFMTSPKDESQAREAANKGRWPANIIHDGSDEVLAEFAKYGELSSHSTRAWTGEQKERKGFCSSPARNIPVMADTGTAARFFYCAKASKRDRDEGVAGVAGVGALRDGGRLSEPRKNHHPTVKPTTLMRYLCKLVTPPSGVVLDPFMGSGSTGKAAKLEGFKFIGIELDKDYFKIASARIFHASSASSSTAR